MRFISMKGEEQSFPFLAAAEIYPHQEPARNLIDSIFDPASDRSPAGLGVAAMEVIDAACTSAATGRNTLIPGSWSPPLVHRFFTRNHLEPQRCPT